jgi:hypothetical protein
MTHLEIAGLIGSAASIITIPVAIYQIKQNARLKDITKSNYKCWAGNTRHIMQSAQWSYDKFTKIIDSANQINDVEQRTIITKLAAQGHGDSAAADRMLKNHLNELLSAQEGLFNTKIISHPEENTF